VRRLVLVALAVVAACGDTVRDVGPPGSIALYVDTDATVPPAGGAPLPAGAPAPLFDRVVIEIYPPNATTPCTGCVNAFALDADLLANKLASIVVAPIPRISGYRAHLRLFLEANVLKDGTPVPGATIDRTVSLPPVDELGRVSITVPLLVDDVGVPVGSLEAPVAAEPGPPKTSRVGTWPGAARVPCADPPGDGEVCVPGGAFWLGVTDSIFSALPGHDEMTPRLTVLSPFYLDATEMTVAEFRTSKSNALAWSGRDDGNSIGDFCTYTHEPGPKEQRPVVCASYGSSLNSCKHAGKTLPTEAQLEYAEGALESRRFVWGEDLPSCEDAIFGRTGWGSFESDTAPCRPPVPPGGPTDVKTATRDRLVLPTGTIYDLAGNVAEWALDDWNRHDEPCWTPLGVYSDPVCHGKSATDGVAHTIRGGDWLVTRGQLSRGGRAAATNLLVSPEIGFRCARPAQLP
jgi:formylglycine-generating enzyme required for sulfatase activity